MKQLFSIVFFLFFTHAVFCQEAVDLGLSVKWATCNVGANKPEEYGNYHTFEETQEFSNSDWRLPTREEINELFENCDYKWTTNNGVNGGLFTSKKNGNSIFLPACGYRYGSEVRLVGSNGYYWSSSVSFFEAYYLYFNGNNAYKDYYFYNYGGRSVRLVQDVKIKKR